MKFMSAVHSDVGIRKKTNQDSLCLKIASTPSGEIGLAVVCDGMGGLKKGEVASATVIRAFSEWFEIELPKLLEQGYDNNKVKEQWSKLIKEQNEAIAEYGNNNYLQLGTTLTAMLINGEDMIIVQVGDSRAYRITEDIFQLTEDQTVAQRDIKLGLLKPEDVNKDTRQNVLLQCIGASKLSPNVVTNEALMKKNLIDLVELNKQREEKDNITAMLLKTM